MDVVDNDMRTYEMTGVMDIDAQNAALDALQPVFDQMAAHLAAQGNYLNRGNQ